MTTAEIFDDRHEHGLSFDKANDRSQLARELHLLAVHISRK
jgi:hypothetical protein